MQQKDTNRDKALELALGSIEKQYGKGAIMRLGEQEHSEEPEISSGSTSLDRCLGSGGYPRGRIIEIFGPETRSPSVSATAASPPSSTLSTRSTSATRGSSASTSTSC